MCSTCGCSESAKPRVTELAEPQPASRSQPDPRPHQHAGHSLTGEHHHGEGALNHTHEHPHDDSSHRTIRLEQDILAKNNRLAERNRGWLEGRNIFAVNLMSAPGAGKTMLLERTIRDLGAQTTICVIEGDQETVRDAERIRATGCRVIQINTGTGCHLDAGMVSRALRELDPPSGSLLFIENVGNLVCPALFDLGEAGRAVIMSVTEGEDKPLKYPHIFRAADTLVLSKADLLPHLEFDLGRCLEYARRINPKLKVVHLSALRAIGLEPWYAWLRKRGESAHDLS
jgi:hydrogenase nickel incorporation protein HypB